MEDRIDSLFELLILRECQEVSAIRSQIRIAETIEWLGKILATPAAIVLENLSRFVTNGIVSLPSGLTRDAIIALTGKTHILGCAQALLRTVAKLKSPEEAYLICWQSALCYGLIGWHDHAYRTLEGAYLFDPQWKRHHHVLGLIHGIDHDFAKAIENLNISYIYETQDDVRGRVGEGLSIATSVPRFSSPRG